MDKIETACYVVALSRHLNNSTWSRNKKRLITSVADQDEANERFLQVIFCLRKQFDKRKEIANHVQMCLH